MPFAADTAAVLSLARALGLPEPRSLRAEPPHGSLSWRLELPGLPDAWIRAAPIHGRDGLDHELAAVLLLAAHELPHPAAWSLVPPELTPASSPQARWALASAPPGRPAVELLDRPAVVLQVAADLGLALARTHERTAAPRFGTAAEGGRFLPIRDRWREEVRARSEEAHAIAVAAGCDLGDTLLPLDHEALDEVESWSLVHRDLRPRNVWVQADGRIAAWTGWERSALGDPLLDWASLLLQPAPVLGAALRGAGPAASELLGERGARARLEVYLRWLLLHELALAASPWFDAADRRRAQVVEQASASLRTAAEALDRLERAPGPVPGWRPDPVADLARRALRLLALEPPPGPSALESLLDALASAWLADRDPTAAPLLERAHAALDRLPVGLPVAGGIRSEVGDPLRFAGDGTSPVLPLLWLARWASDRLGGRVGSGVRPGLEVLARQASAVDLPQASGPRRLARAARGLGAATALGLPADRLREAVEDAWDALSGGHRATAGQEGSATAALAAAPWTPGLPTLLAALLAAGGDRLPDTPGALLALVR